ncbi:uncharacterized protein LOC121417992 [Lytechinus variegatus]|uniref:uncharacterized protein LOC121417992 n=1 Tax=Lytechinus variegatus TaxID=7654 RepID=UPI001BB1D17B|nr:uncharacterized protein LOC121417992 [Lytechinus variegatus]
MAGPGEIYSVPDLYCFEDLPNFEHETNSHLYDDSTSTKDSHADLSMDSALQCAVCSSVLCNDRHIESSTQLPGTPCSQWDPNGNVSYHDVWCDDDSWKFSSSEQEDSQVTQSSTLSSSTPSCAGEPHTATDIEGALHQVESSGGSLHDAAESESVSSENLAEMSDEDIFAVSPSVTQVSWPDRFDIEDFATWELSQISPLSSQSSALLADELEDSQLVPNLQTILQNHRHSAGDQVAGAVEIEGNTENEDGQRNELIFNTTCAATEQVVPDWHTEE